MRSQGATKGNLEEGVIERRRRKWRERRGRGDVDRKAKDNIQVNAQKALMNVREV